MAEPDALSPRSPHGLSTQTMVSVGLTCTLLAAAWFAGRQMQRLDSVDETARETRAEVQQMRTDFQNLRVLILQLNAQNNHTPNPPGR